jgi:hypothetical protein
MASRLDLAAYNRDNQLILVVEVKKLLGISKEWATRLRRNMLAHGTLPNVKFFLLAFPDRFYLWNDADIKPVESEPTYTIDVRPILAPYFKRSGITSKQISEESFELIVASWLGELIHSHKSPEELQKSQKWLIDSGLYATLEGGRLEHEVLA